MKRDDDKQSERLVGWLANFADRQGEHLAKTNNIPVEELKSAGYMENILDIVNRNKKTSVEAKVEHYRQLVGLDMVDNIEKEALKTATASRVPLSIRDKKAEEDPKLLLNNIKQYITQVISNRNGAIATPAILDQLENYMKVDKEWLRNNYEELEQVIEAARKDFKPETYNDVSVQDLTRTDDPSKGEKEPPPFLPPASAPGV